MVVAQWSDFTTYSMMLFAGMISFPTAAGLYVKRRPDLRNNWVEPDVFGLATGDQVTRQPRRRYQVKKLESIKGEQVLSVEKVQATKKLGDQASKQTAKSSKKLVVQPAQELPAQPAKELSTAGKQ